MNEISLKSGIVVKVNDAGETITVNVEDQLFVDKFYNLIEKIEKAREEVDTKEFKELSERDQLKAVIEKTKVVMNEIDELFGEDACRKVFGNIVPSLFLIADFFEQMTPIAEQYMDERQKKISSRYNRNRKAGSKNKYRTKEEIIRDNMR